MKRIALCLSLLLVLLLGVARASDPIAVYALIDKVVFEPNSDTPDRIQIWGAFALAKKNDRNLYEAPVRGYLYLKLQPGKEEVCRKEWADLKKLAGTRECAGFGNRFELITRVRSAQEKAESPDTYGVSWGMSRMRGDTEYEPIKALLALAPASK